MAEAKEDTISQAVVKALSEMPNAKKTGEGKIKGEGKSGYYEYDYQYAELDKILAIATPIFASHDLAIMQDVKTENGSIGAKTIFLHDSGSRMESSWLMLPGGHGAQSYGSAESYARRYSLMAFLGIAAEDDDGAAATESAKPREKPVGNTPTPSEGPAPEKRDRTPGDASLASLNFARGLFFQLGIADPPVSGEEPAQTEDRREKNCFKIAEWLSNLKGDDGEDQSFESNGHDDELLYMNQSTLSKVIDKVKAEIAKMDVG